MRHWARSLGSIGLALSLLTSTPLMAESYSKPSSPSYSRPSQNYSRPPSYSKPSTSNPPSSYSKPPPSYTKPPITESNRPALPPPTYTKPAEQSRPTPAIAQPSKPAPPRSAADAAIARGQSKQAYTQFQADQQKYKAPPIAAPQDKTAAQQTPAWREYGNRWNSADSYYSSRNSALQRAPAEVRDQYVNPPSYVTAGRPSYGAYAAAFLGGALLANITQPAYAQWAYSHREDPGYKAWREDMEKQAADNAELRTKLATLDDQVNQLKAKNAPVTEALPPDVDPALVVAPQTALLATQSSSNTWLWVIVSVMMLIIIFFVACIIISRRRVRY